MPGWRYLRGALVPVQDLLRMSEQQSFLIRFSIVMGIVNIALDLWLDSHPRRHRRGLGQRDCPGAGDGGSHDASRREGLGLKVPLGDMGRILLACLPMLIVVRTIAESLHPWHAVLFGVPLGAALYMVGLKVLRVLRPVDYDRLTGLDRSLPTGLRPVYQRALGWLVAQGATP